MKSMKRIFLIAIIFCVLIQGNVFAKSKLESKIDSVQYTKEYKEWLEFSDEEKNKVMMPRRYEIEANSKNIVSSTNNPLITQLVKNSNDSKFSLKEVLGNTITVKNQKSVNLCWAFATLGAIESTLSYQDYRNFNILNQYDFSERHMDYAVTRDAFLNNEINEKGFTRDMKIGGNLLIAEAYLTNGSGAIAETEMPFENNQNQINLSEIKNKNVLTTVYDIDELSFRISDKSELMQEMKTFLSMYGGLYAGVHGADLFESKYYNNETGAICTDNSAQMDHAVVVIGWDDNFSKDNFNENCRPQNDGAWIIKNSWGETQDVTMDEFKRQNYEANEAAYNQNGIYNYNDIPDQAVIEYLTSLGYTANSDNTVFSYSVGDKGYMYISYEDYVVYQNVWGIKRAVNKKDYDNIYQHDILGWSTAIQLNYTGSTYIANSFLRTTSDTENLSKISIYTPTDLKSCKVYVNPNSTDKAKVNLREIPLKEADASTNTIDISEGYHMIEFAEPISLSGNGFSVVLKYQSDEASYIAVESVASNGWENAVVNNNESFLAIGDDFENNNWVDLNTLENTSLRGNATLKAFTDKISSEEVAELSSIAIINSPTKIMYEEGENFDAAGMVVVASYSDGTKKTINTYTIENGVGLKAGQTSVKVIYTENNITKQAEQAITVVSSNNSSNPKSPKSSDFSKANAKIESIDINTSSKVAKIVMKVSNIVIGDVDDEYTYYYCITGSTSNTDIQDNYWLPISKDRITKESNGTYTIAIETNLYDLPNISELLMANKLYLHMKEIVSINGTQVESIHVLDIAEISESTTTSNSNNSNTNSNSTSTGVTQSNSSNTTNTTNTTDNTVANNILPKTGKWNVLIVISILLIGGGFAYFRYKNIDK